MNRLRCAKSRSCSELSPGQNVANSRRSSYCSTTPGMKTPTTREPSPLSSSSLSCASEGETDPCALLDIALVNEADVLHMAGSPSQAMRSHRRSATTRSSSQGALPIVWGLGAESSPKAASRSLSATAGSRTQPHTPKSFAAELEASLSPKSPSRRRHGGVKLLMESEIQPPQTELDCRLELAASGPTLPSRRMSRCSKLLARSQSLTGEVQSPSSPLRRKCRGDKLLKDAFGAFAFGRAQMYPRDFERLCLSSSLFDSKFMMCDARRIFGGQLAKGQRSIGFEQFEKLLHEVAFERQCHVSTVHHMVGKTVKSTRQPRCPPKSPSKCANSAFELLHGLESAFFSEEYCAQGH